MAAMLAASAMVTSAADLPKYWFAPASTARGIARQADGVQVRFQNLFLAETVVQRDARKISLTLRA